MKSSIKFNLLPTRNDGLEGKLGFFKKGVTVGHTHSPNFLKGTINGEPFRAYTRLDIGENQSGITVVKDKECTEFIEEKDGSFMFYQKKEFVRESAQSKLTILKTGLPSISEYKSECKDDNYRMSTGVKICEDGKVIVESLIEKAPEDSGTELKHRNITRVIRSYSNQDDYFNGKKPDEITLMQAGEGAVKRTGERVVEDEFIRQKNGTYFCIRNGNTISIEEIEKIMEGEQLLLEIPSTLKPYINGNKTFTIPKEIETIIREMERRHEKEEKLSVK